MGIVHNHPRGYRAPCEGAISFDAKGARYTHRDGLCSFEVLIADCALGGDPALALMARVVHGADVSEDRDATPESPGLLAIADGFALLGLDDRDSLSANSPPTTRSTHGPSARSRWRAERPGRRVAEPRGAWPASQPVVARPRTTESPSRMARHVE